MQLDEKWSFVGKKQKHCDPDAAADWVCGDQWDHVALDPDSRLVLDAIVPVESEGQGIALDPADPQALWSIQRKTAEVLVSRIAW